MNITILIKLLETHSKKPGPGMQMRKEPGRSVLLKQTVDMGKAFTYLFAFGKPKELETKSH